MRQISGLKWAERAERAVHGRPRGLKGAKGMGLAYERLLANALPGGEAGVWWKYEDKNGWGACQTDLVLVGMRSVLVLEAKYTWTEDAFAQLEGLYRPVVEMAAGKPVICVQVCRNLRAESGLGLVFGDLAEAVKAAKQSGVLVTLHWRGTRPLYTQGGKFAA